MEALKVLPLFIIMPRVKQFNETDVLNKAMDLFWKQGYAATSISDLVSHLGINRASIYDTFGDKEQLFLKAFNHYRSTNQDAIESFLKSQQNIKEGFTSLFKMAIEEAIKDKDRKGCFVVNTTTELIPNDEKVTQLLEKNKEDFQAIFYRYLVLGQKKGQISQETDCKTTATLLFILYNGIRVVSKVERDRKVLLESISIVIKQL